MIDVIIVSMGVEETLELTLRSFLMYAPPQLRNVIVCCHWQNQEQIAELAKRLCNKVDVYCLTVTSPDKHEHGWVLDEILDKVITWPAEQVLFIDSDVEFKDRSWWDDVYARNEGYVFVAPEWPVHVQEQPMGDLLNCRGFHGYLLLADLKFIRDQKITLQRAPIYIPAGWIARYPKIERLAIDTFGYLRFAADREKASYRLISEDALTGVTHWDHLESALAWNWTEEAERKLQAIRERLHITRPAWEKFIAANHRGFSGYPRLAES